MMRWANALANELGSVGGLPTIVLFPRGFISICVLKWFARGLLVYQTRERQVDEACFTLTLPSPTQHPSPRRKHGPRSILDLTPRQHDFCLIFNPPVLCFSRLHYLKLTWRAKTTGPPARLTAKYQRTWTVTLVQPGAVWRPRKDNLFRSCRPAWAVWSQP